MHDSRHAFLSGWDALFILLGLHFIETLVGAVVDDYGPRLGLGETGMSVLTLLLASTVLFTLAMRFTRTGFAELLHASPAPPAAALALVPAVLALVPVLALGVTGVTDWLIAQVPLAAWEEELFASMSSDTVSAILLVCLFAPVVEEMLFRGLILRGFLARYAQWPAILASAVLFGASHLNIYQFMVGLMIGIPLGWLYARTRSLIPCIALHAGYNISVTWLDLQGAADAPVAWWEGSFAAWGVALALAALSGAALVRMLQPARA